MDRREEGIDCSVKGGEHSVSLGIGCHVSDCSHWLRLLQGMKGGELMPNITPDELAEFDRNLLNTQRKMVKVLAENFTAQEIANVYVLDKTVEVFDQAYLMAQVKEHT